MAKFEFKVTVHNAFEQNAPSRDPLTLKRAGLFWPISQPEGKISETDRWNIKCVVLVAQGLLPIQNPDI